MTTVANTTTVGMDLQPTLPPVGSLARTLPTNKFPGDTLLSDARVEFLSRALFV